MKTKDSFRLGLSRMPADGRERMETVGWLIRTIRLIDRDKRVDHIESICFRDTPAPMVRNRIIRAAQRANCDYLLCVDNDMCPDLPLPGNQQFWPTTWNFLMKRRARERRLMEEITDNGKILPGDDRFFFKTGSDEPVCLKSLMPATVAAPYCGPPPHECVYVFRWAMRQSDCPDPTFILEMMNREECAYRGGIEEVAALPTGLILYDLRVFDILPPPWYDYEYEDSPYNTMKASTEDVYQTRNASLLGLPQYCNWSAWSGHVKDKIVQKPQVITREQVHDSLVDAVLHRDWNHNERLVMVGEGRGARPPAPTSMDQVQSGFVKPGLRDLQTDMYVRPGLREEH